MLAWLIVPLQYLFMRWRAENLLGRAQKATGFQHGRLLNRSRKAVEEVEKMQLRFPGVTERLDNVTRRNALRQHISS